MEAELYSMEKALSVREDPEWVVPYATIADDYDDLLQDFEAYAQVSAFVHTWHVFQGRAA